MATLLVVENDVRLADTMARALVRDGHDVRLAGSAEQAMRLAGVVPYEGIVMDVSLPGMDGLEACRRMRRGGLRTPVVVIGDGAGLSEAELRSAGVDRWLPRPFSSARLLSAVEMAMRLPSVGARWPEGAGLADGVIAAIGAGACRTATDALGRVTGRPLPVVAASVAGVCLTAVEPWRIAVQRGPAGTVELALAGTVWDAAGTPPERLTAELGRAVARRWSTGGFESMTDALERSADHLLGAFFVIAAGGEALRVAVLARGASPLVLRAESSAIVSSTVLALPPHARIDRLALRDRTATTVTVSPPARAPSKFSHRRPRQARFTGPFLGASHNAA